MRRCWLIAILLLVVGCSKDIDFEPSQDQAQNRILSGIIADEKDEDNESRVYLDNKIRIRWNKGDLISVFDGTTRNKEFAFLGADGSSAGDFSDNSAGTIGTGNAIDRLYGLYPYASSTEYCYGEDESEADYLRYTLPATQTYKPSSIGLNANLMVAATANKSDKTLVFRNVCSYLRLKLYGADQTVSSIVFKGNTDEVLTGDVAITATYGNAPTIKMLGAAEEDNKTITLDCSEGVTVGRTSDEATEFWLVVPPVNFPNGFTITVKGEGNMGQEIVINNNLTFARNTYNTITREVAMTEVSDPSTEIPNNQIWYTATAKVTPYNTDGFGAAIVANEWDSATGNGVITFSHAIKSIGKRAFDGCRSLTSITLPEGITQIEAEAFFDCISLTSITLPESLTQIGKNAFFRCTSLTSITLPESVTQIGDYAFDGCTSLASITLPEGVTQIGSSAFSSCTSLTSITLPEGVTQIGTYAFENCPSLTSITLPESLTQIGGVAFYGCTSLTSITLPESLTQIGTQAFCGCTSLIEVYCKPTTPPAGGTDMFYKNAPGRKIYVPAGSGEAYKTAQYWSDYASIIEEMGSETPPDNEIWYTATAKVVPNNVTAYDIESNEWDETTGKGVITFSHAIKSIGKRAFYDCSSLTSITLPEGVTQIEAEAFAVCTSLTSISLPEGLTQIGDYAFLVCTSLTSITLPEGLTQIGNYAFESCGSLTSITLPESLTQIGYNPFYGCDALSKFDGKFASADGRYLIDDGVLLAFAPSGLTEYTIPEGVTQIRDYAFSDCNSLASITLPESLTQIGNYAFNYCTSLTSITLPEGVTQIGTGAFEYCTSLIEVYCKPTTPPAGGIYMFHYNAPGQKIYVPAGSGEAYKTAQYWSNYASIIEEEESEPDDTWKIYYTATAKVEPYRENAFNVSIESNQWDSATGEGVITFNGEVNSIGSYAFYSCRNLKSIQIPENVTTIGTAAFRECFKLKDVYLNSKIESIGNSAFVGCFDFYNSTYGSINFHMNSIADWCQIDLPTEVVSGQETIYLYVNGSLIKDIDIPSSINAIKPYAFKFCYVKKITMHKDVTSIGKEAFYDSPVDAIYCKSTTPPAGCEDMFKETSLSYIYVPEESVNSYKTAQYWSSYSSKITPYNFE